MIFNRHIFCPFKFNYVFWKLRNISPACSSNTSSPPGCWKGKHGKVIHTFCHKIHLHIFTYSIPRNVQCAWVFGNSLSILHLLLVDFLPSQSTNMHYIMQASHFLAACGSSWLLLLLSLYWAGWVFSHGRNWYQTIYIDKCDKLFPNHLMYIHLETAHQTLIQIFCFK